MTRRHLFLLFCFIVGAIIVTLANRYLTFHFNSISQNLYRFLAGSVLMAVLCSGRWEQVVAIWRRRRDRLKVIVCGLFMASLMYLVVLALSGISAVTASILSTIQLPTNIVLAMLLFTDERSREPRAFALGMVALLSATGCYVWSSGQRSDGVDHLWAIGLFLVAIVIRSVLMLVLKDVLRRHNSVVVAAASTWVCTATLLLAGVATTSVQSPGQAGPWIAALLIGSGVLGIWVGTALNNELIHGIGIVRLFTFAALIPPGVAGAGWLLLGESVSIAQVLAGAVMMLCVIHLARLKHGPEPVYEEIPASEVAAPARDVDAVESDFPESEPEATSPSFSNEPRP